jgi:sugar phosphate isomerase/epimerase
MHFGVCTTVDQSSAAKAAGWDFVEVRVDQFILGLVPDEQWTGAAAAAGSALPIRAANVLVPPAVKITGPAVDRGQLERYMNTVMRRCAAIGISQLVFGSGGARNVPGGFDRNAARGQIIDFLRMIAPMAQARGITIAIEHLNAMECNIINSLDEAMTYVKELNHPAIRCVFDTFHFWLNEEPMESLRSAAPWVSHVHLADVNRTAPGTTGRNDYRPVFAELKRAGYRGALSVEAVDFDLVPRGRAVLEYVKDLWETG